MKGEVLMNIFCYYCMDEGWVEGGAVRCPKCNK